MLLGTGAALTWFSSGESAIQDERPVLSETHTSSINEIVSEVVSGRFRAPNYRDYEHHVVGGLRGDTEDDDEEADFVNPKREFKSITTDVVNRHFLKNKSNVFEFLKIVIGTHIHAIDLYTAQKDMDRGSIRFFYKGGNVLRIIASEFLIEMPGHAHEAINAFYMPYFRRSDADFSINIDPKLSNFEEVHRDMTNLTWLLQQYIRDRMAAQPWVFFDFYRLNRAARHEILEEYLQALNESDTLRDETSDLFFGGEFLGVRFEGVSTGNDPTLPSKDADKFIVFNKARKTVVFEPEPSESSSFRIQYNTALDFGEGYHHASFHLVRTKIIFSVLFRNNVGEQTPLRLGGELIDVAIPTRDDSKMSDFFEKKGAIQAYELRYGDRELQFMGSSLDYLVDDLIYILWEVREYPWDDNKYRKRLNRLFYLSFVQLFIQLEGNRQRAATLKDFCQRVVRGDKASARKFVKKNEKRLGKKSGFLALGRLIPRTQVSRDNVNHADWLKFMEYVEENCVVLLSSFRDIGGFCSRSNVVEEKRIYDGQFSALVRDE